MRAVGWRLRLAAAVASLGLVGGLALADERGGGGAVKFIPYTGYKYQLQWKSGHYAAGFSSLVPVLTTGGGKERPIGLENGEASDTAFAGWAQATAKAHSGAGQLQDIRLEVRAANGALTSAHDYKSCWASSYNAVPVLNYKGTGIPVQELVLLCGKS
jgi:hypothetical protein